jgi:hypothetical protein
MRYFIRTAYIVGSSIVCLTLHNLLVLYSLSDMSITYLHFLLCYTFVIVCFCFILYYVGRLFRLYTAKYILGFVWFLFVTMAQQPLVDQGLLMIEDSWLHSDTPLSVGLLWTSDQPEAETSTSQHTTLTRHIHSHLVFELTIPASARLQTHDLDRAATEIGCIFSLLGVIYLLFVGCCVVWFVFYGSHG